MYKSRWNFKLETEKHCSHSYISMSFFFVIQQACMEVGFVSYESVGNFVIVNVGRKDRHGTGAFYDKNDTQSFSLKQSLNISEIELRKTF